MKVRVEHDAEAELLDAAWHYERQRSGLSEAFLLTFAQALRSIGEFPQSYPLFRRKAGREFRFRLLKPFDYVVVFEVRSREIVVLAVSHVRRGARYWSRRLSSPHEEE